MSQIAAKHTAKNELKQNQIKKKIHLIEFARIIKESHLFMYISNYKSLNVQGGGGGGGLGHTLYF